MKFARKERSAITSTGASSAACGPQGNQLTLSLGAPSATKPGRGGRRRGSGRKLAPGKRRTVPHRPREAHAGRHPVHVTLRAVAGLPSFRQERVRNLLLRAMAAQTTRLGNFRVVHFSIQTDHLHLILEAGVPTEARAAPRQEDLFRLPSPSHEGQRETPSEETSTKPPDAILRSAMIGLATSLARRLNRMLGRRGHLWNGRHHRRDLESPTAVRRALLYVLQNHVHHGRGARGDLDPLSSAHDHEVWTVAARSPGARASPSREPRSWLLSIGWLRAGGLLDPAESPR